MDSGSIDKDGFVYFVFALVQRFPATVIKNNVAMQSCFLMSQCIVRSTNVDLMHYVLCGVHPAVTQESVNQSDRTLFEE